MRTLVLFLVACGNTEPADFREGGSRSGDRQFGMGSPDQGSEGADTGTGGPCGGDDACDLTVSGVAVSAGESDSGHSVSATASGSGVVSVLETSAAYGCCPDVVVAAQLDTSSGRIAATSTFGTDMCACFLVLDLAYTLTGVPAGTWTLDVGGASTTVAVP